jgi:hypothetical protein
MPDLNNYLFPRRNLECGKSAFDLLLTGGHFFYYYTKCDNIQLKVNLKIYLSQVRRS